jgi:hypothetical protein
MPKVKLDPPQPELVLQGAVIASKRLEGATIQDLARDFNLSEATVRKRIEASRQVDLVEIARGIITDRLVPLALAVVDKELKKGNYQAAKDVLQGIGVFAKKGDVAPPTSATSILDAIRAESAIDVNGEKNGPK